MLFCAGQEVFGVLPRAYVLNRYILCLLFVYVSLLVYEELRATLFLDWKKSLRGLLIPGYTNLTGDRAQIM